MHMSLASSWANTIKYDGRNSRRGGGSRFLAITLGHFQVGHNHASKRKQRLRNIEKSHWSVELIVCF
jgi:hypothetical protein